jgi:capsular polysaccharide transport system permease protein
VQPTLAERSVVPDRMLLVGLVALFAFLIWGVLVLAAYALRDRR